MVFSISLIALNEILKEKMQFLNKYMNFQICSWLVTTILSAISLSKLFYFRFSNKINTVEIKMQNPIFQQNLSYLRHISYGILLLS